mgnify:FL=1
MRPQVANSDCHFSFPGTRVATEPGRAAPPEAVPGSGMPAPSKVALLGWAFINDSDDARNTPAEPFRDAALAAGAEVRVHDPWVDPVTSPDAPPGLSRDIEGVLTGADAVVVFAGHKEYRGMVPAQVEGDDRGELQGDGPDALARAVDEVHLCGVVLAVPDDRGDGLAGLGRVADAPEGVVVDDGLDDLIKRLHIGDREREFPEC